MNPKQLAGETAVGYLRKGMVVGLGTGSTAKFFIEALAAALRIGRLSDIRGIPTSRNSEALAEKLGIPLTNFSEVERCDVTVDGADEVGPGLNLVKGAGGALLREKLVAQNSGRLVIVVDASKEVPKLGTKYALPVEVTTFSHEAAARYLRELGSMPALRMTAEGAPYLTDNGNLIYDCRFPGIPEPEALERKLASRAGIVETGLFLGLADTVLVADADGVRTLKREGSGE